MPVVIAPLCMVAGSEAAMVDCPAVAVTGYVLVAEDGSFAIAVAVCLFVA